VRSRRRAATYRRVFALVGEFVVFSWQSTGVYRFEGGSGLSIELPVFLFTQNQCLKLTR